MTNSKEYSSEHSLIKTQKMKYILLENNHKWVIYFKKYLGSPTTWIDKQQQTN